MVHTQDDMENQKHVNKICSDLKSNEESFTDLEIDGEHAEFDGDALLSLSQCLKENNTLQRLAFNSGTFSNSCLQELMNVVKNMKNMKELLFEDINDANSCLVELLAVALFYNRNIQSLALRGCWTDSPVPAFSVNALMNSARNLSELHFSHNQIDKQGAAALSLALRCHRSLETLDLTGSSMDCEALKQLCCGLTQNRYLKKLILDFNAFGDDGVTALSDMLVMNTGLVELHLFGNNISAKGAVALSDALVLNKFLNSIVLSFNQIGDEGLTAIAESLTVNNSLRKIWIPSNSVGFEGMKSLAEYLPNMRGLEFLHVGLLLDESSVDAFAGALRHSHYLKILHFEQPCLLEHEHSSPASSVIDFFLRLNRTGRQHIRQKKIESALWPYILVRGMENSSAVETPDILYYLLRENPELLDQRRRR